MYKKFFQFVAFFLISLIAVSCDGGCSDEPGGNDDPAKRTVLVYMLADNNLGSTFHFDEENINAMRRAIREQDIDGRLLILYNSKNGAPCLQEIVKNKQGYTQIDTLKLYTYDFDVTEVYAMDSIMNDVERLAPANSYGLVMWSHATGWLPNNKYYTTPAAAPTSFGREGEEKAYIEIDELQDALSDHFFDFILFDACLMGSIEVAYELRNVCNYMISASTETMGAGFPYYEITPLFFEDNVNYLAICQHYYDTYIAPNPDYPYNNYGTISLVKTRELEQLAEASKNIIATTDSSAGYNAYGIQYLDRTNVHVMYDMEHFLSQYCNDAQLTELHTALKNAIKYKAASDYFISIRINRYCGLSCYIPGTGDEEVEEYYKTLDWYNRVYK